MGSALTKHLHMRNDGLITQKQWGNLRLSIITSNPWVYRTRWIWTCTVDIPKIDRKIMGMFRFSCDTLVELTGTYS